MDEPVANSTSAADAAAAENPPPPAPARTIGERLRAARERSGLSVPAVAEKLHLDNKIVESLESDHFGEIGASVYVRGHLKRYADFLGESGADLVAMYSARETRPLAPDLTQVPHAERRADPRRLLKPLVAAGCAAALLAAIWWVLVGSRPRTAPSTVATVEAAPAPVPAAPAPVESAEVTPTPDSPSAVVSTAPATRVAPTSAASPAAPVKEVPVRDIQLRLELSNDSWVEVYDSQGERLFYDVATAGSVQSVSGRAPMRVVLGNSAGVVVDVDGQRREIPANAADGEGARFVVNRSGSLSRAR